MVATRKETTTMNAPDNLTPNASTLVLMEQERSWDQIIGRRLTQIRESASMTLADLSALTGVPKEILKENKIGSEPLSLSRMKTIAASLGVHPLDLLAAILFPGSIPPPKSPRC